MGSLRILLLCLAASLGLGACADDTVPPPMNGRPGGRGGTSGSGGSAGSGGTGGTGGAAGSDGTAGSGGSAGSGGTAGSGGFAGSGGTGGTGGALSGACINQADLTALADLWPSNARQVAASCGIACEEDRGSEEVFTSCANDCVEQTVTGLSSACATCYGQLAWCSSTECINECDSEQCSVGCLGCDGYGGCLDDLEACTGRVSVDCTDPT